MVAGPTMSFNSGAVEGIVNRVKQLKAAMCGRAKPDLLRKLILRACEQFRRWRGRCNALLEQPRRRRVRPARPSHALIEASGNSSTRGHRPQDRIHAAITERAPEPHTANNDN
jgi:hypothetical protein